MQYMYKISCKIDKDFLRYSMFLHHGPTRPAPPPPPQPWDFQKGPAQVGLNFTIENKIGSLIYIK